jgi:hypothetical protein
MGSRVTREGIRGQGLGWWTCCAPPSGSEPQDTWTPLKDSSIRRTKSETVSSAPNSRRASVTMSAPDFCGSRVASVAEAPAPAASSTLKSGLNSADAGRVGPQ